MPLTFEETLNKLEEDHELFVKNLNALHPEIVATKAFTKITINTAIRLIKLVGTKNGDLTSIVTDVAAALSAHFEFGVQVGIAMEKSLHEDIVLSEDSK